MKSTAILLSIVAASALLLPTTASATSINVISTFSNIDAIDDLNGATLVFDGVYDGNGTDLYVNSPPNTASAGTAATFQLTISGAFNGALNGVYNPTTDVHYTFLNDFSQAMSATPTGGNIEFSVGGETLGAFLSFANGPGTATVGNSLATTDFNVFPGSSTLSSAVLTLSGLQGGSEIPITGLSVTQGVQAVPEPSTWLLMSLGGIAMLLTARRRRQQVAA